jgi:hypothetical protein
MSSAPMRGGVGHRAGRPDPKRFQGSVALLLAHVVADRGLREEPLQRLHRMIQERRRK